MGRRPALLAPRRTSPHQVAVLPRRAGPEDQHFRLWEQGVGRPVPVRRPLVSDEKEQILHALEAAARVQQVPHQDVRKEAYHIRTRTHPFHVIRQNKMLSVLVPIDYHRHAPLVRQAHGAAACPSARPFCR